MRTTTKFKNIPAGILQSIMEDGKMAKVLSAGFFSSEDGNQFIECLESFPQEVLSNISIDNPKPPSSITSLLVVINSDKSADVYLNEPNIIKVRPKKPSIKKGQVIYSNDILDVHSMTLNNIEISDQAGFFYFFTAGWCRGFAFDFIPITQKVKRDYDVCDWLGSLYNYLFFYNRFNLDETTWEGFIKQRWFPFAHLDDKLLYDMIQSVKNGSEIDKYLDRISNCVDKLLENNVWLKTDKTYFKVHEKMFLKAIERYQSKDYMSCISLLYQRIEGLMRSFNKFEKSAKWLNQKNLLDNIFSQSENKLLQVSLLHPRRFKKFLAEVYFASFEPGTSPNVSRHSAAHGEAGIESFDKKNAMLGILILFQLLAFLTDNES